MKIISSSTNSFFKLLKKIKKNNGHLAKEKVAFLEGRKLVKDILELKPELIENIIISKDFSLDDLDISLSDKRIVILEEKLFSQISFFSSPQGIAILVKTELFYQSGISGKRVLCCYGIQDPINLGGILRTAEIFSFTEIVLINSVKPLHYKVLRASQGAPFLLKFLEIKAEDAVSFLEKLKEEGGYQIVSSSLDSSSLPLQKVLSQIKEKLILVVGSEGQGVPKKIISLSDLKVKIEQSGKLESLNVSVATGILTYFLSLNFKR